MESCRRPIVVNLDTDPSFASGEIGFMAYGAMGIRTPDLLNAIEALYQLSYDPKFSGLPLDVTLVGLGGFEPPTSPLSGVRSNQLSYRPEGHIKSK